MAMGEVQQFASAPQAVGSRRKYRDPEEAVKTNMMHDRRVVRGNTYASLVQPQPDMAEVQKEREAQRRRLMRANQTKKRAGSPEPVPGRKHMDIQTDTYLEELTERTVEFEAETQTDFFLDRPPSPLFMPAKIGVDIDTQIEDGELFDFDVEVEPVLEVVVGKTLEQAMMEVLEELELESLRRHQEEFEKMRQTELQEVQRMEAAEKRRADELQRRLQQQAALKERDLSTMRKVVSQSIGAAYLSGLKERVFQKLDDAGIFADPVELAVQKVFMPQLLQMVAKQYAKTREEEAAKELDLQTATEDRLLRERRALDKERARLEAIDEAEREARRQKKLAEEQEAARKEQEEQDAARKLQEAWRESVQRRRPEGADAADAAGDEEGKQNDEAPADDPEQS